MAAKRARRKSPRSASGHREAPENAARTTDQRILSIDVGGSNAKMLLLGETEPRRCPTGRRFTPTDLVGCVKELTSDWDYDVVSIGIPAVVAGHGAREEPGNLGPGWVGFDFASALGHPVKIVNDATMQALGSYTGGRMLFLGLGTGLGSTLIAEHVIVPLELGALPYRGKSLAEHLGRAGMRRIGKKRWRSELTRACDALLRAFVVDYLVLGGGNAVAAEDLPPGVRVGNNHSAFRGGYRLWGNDIVPTHEAESLPPPGARVTAEWRLI